MPLRAARSVLSFARAAAIALLALGCNQFASIGTVDEEDQDVAAPPDAGPADATAAGDAGAQPADGAAPEDAATECVPIEVVGPCNPLTNEGCDVNLAMQCAVDLLATVPTGYCIFSAPPPSTIGSACLNSGVTESCPPISSCVDGICRALCLCDADCGQEMCCTRALENTGFKVCRDC